jgi:hypothetical protein
VKSPYDDIAELLQNIKRNNELREQGVDVDPLIVRPKNFMMKHQDFFRMKSFMIDDFKHLTI